MAAAAGDIRAIIDRLVEERQSLRVESGSPAALDANRKALAYWQVELSRALMRETTAATPATT
jgi:hypothetical protein